MRKGDIKQGRTLTNKPSESITFERWEEIFKDTMLTGAIVDRLSHRAHIMDMS